MRLAASHLHGVRDPQNLHRPVDIAGSTHPVTGPGSPADHAAVGANRAGVGNTGADVHYAAFGRTAAGGFTRGADSVAAQHAIRHVVGAIRFATQRPGRQPQALAGLLSEVTLITGLVTFGDPVLALRHRLIPVAGVAGNAGAVATGIGNLVTSGIGVFRGD